MMFAVYILAAIAILQGIATLLDGIRSAGHMKTFRPTRDRRDRIVVFCPCKGIDAEFEENIRSILDQDYANYEVRFVVESHDDEAYAALKSIGIERILVAGRTSNRGQKVHNLAYAVEQTRPAGDIYVFCDSDARFPRGWLSKLIAPLTAETITTGYRWYVADRFHLPTLLRSAWNASSVSILGGHNRNFAWGGSMAMHRDTFDRLNVLESWRGAVSDDYAVMRAAERGGARIIFVPECLIPSYGECGWRELLEFTTRQIIITRVYYPLLWRAGFIGHAVFNAAFFILPFTQPVLWFAVYTLSIAKSWVRYRAVQTVLPVRPAMALSKHGWFYILCVPLAAVLYLYNMVRSAVGTHIVWRRIHYELVSPNETRVFGGSGASGS